MLLIIVMYFILSLIFLIGKASAIEAQPVFFVGMRLLVAGVALLIFEEWKSKGVSKFLREQRHHLKEFAFLSLFISYGNFVPTFIAAPYVTSIKFNLLWTLSPFVTAIIAHTLYNEKLHLGKILGICVAFAAMLPNIFMRASSGGGLSGFGSWPELFIILGTSCGAYGWFLFRDLRKKGFSPFLANGLAMVLAMPATFITSYFIEDWSKPLFHSWPNFLFLLAAMVIIANIAYFNLYAYAIHHYPITFVTLCMFMAPLWGALLGWFLLGEKIGWTFYVALAGVSVGLYLFSRERKGVQTGPIAPE